MSTTEKPGFSFTLTYRTKRSLWEKIDQLEAENSSLRGDDREELTTMEELDALVPGTIIVDDEGHAWHKHKNDSRWHSDDNGAVDSPLFWKPFRVLHTPPPWRNN